MCQLSDSIGPVNHLLVEDKAAIDIDKPVEPIDLLDPFPERIMPVEQHPSPVPAKGKPPLPLPHYPLAITALTPDHPIALQVLTASIVETDQVAITDLLDKTSLQRGGDQAATDQAGECEVGQ